MAAAGTWHLPDGLWGRFLRSLLDGRLAYFSLFVIVHTVLAFTTPGATVHAVLASMTPGAIVLKVVELVLICTPQGILALHRTMSTPVLIVSAVGLDVAAALGITSLPPNGRWPGYDAWQLGAITISLFGFALIGRYITAWATLLTMAAIAVGWSISTGQEWAPGVALVDRHFGTLLVGTLFAWSLARSNATFTAYRALERRTRAVDRAATARAGARRSAAEAVLEQAGPMLRAIADGHPLTDADRRELLVLEGALRDGIRAPNLAKGALRDAIAGARRRGVNVLLLDEVDGEADPVARERAATWLAERVDASHGERFVGRVRNVDGGLAVSAVTGAVSDWVTIPAPAAASAGASRASSAPTSDRGVRR